MVYGFRRRDEYTNKMEYHLYKNTIIRWIRFKQKRQFFFNISFYLNLFVYSENLWDQL